jgi:type VI secretion system protein ImpA
MGTRDLSSNDMQTDTHTSYAALLDPISETSPCGDDLLLSTDFDAIQQARRFDDPSLDQGEWVTDIKEADWPFVITHCTTLLSTRTKDLRLAVWLTEALAIRDGLAGLTAGYRVLTGLVERYWEQIHPLADGDDAEYRLANVGWLAGRSAELLRVVPLTQSGMAFSALDWEVATNAAQAAKRDPDHADDILRGKPSIEQIDASKRATAVAFYSTLLDQLRAFEAAMNALDTQLDQRAGDSAPSFRRTRDTYDTVYRLAERFARDVGANTHAAPNPPEAPPPVSSPPERSEPRFIAPLPLPSDQEPDVTVSRFQSAQSTQPVGPAGIRSREDAVAQLRAVAVFFRRTEPHSPAAYLADKAAEWADMPLHQWLSAVVKDDGSLAHLRELLGVKEG